MAGPVSCLHGEFTHAYTASPFGERTPEAPSPSPPCASPFGGMDPKELAATRGWHSKNATFTIRNYLNGALLYYHHLCHKGRDKVIEEELYKGTSKSAEGYAARVTFKKAKEEGMQVAIHWPDADSSSAKAVSEVFPDAEIMICDGHAGHAHRKILELRHKMKKVPKKMLQKYRDTFPALGKLRCNEVYTGNQKPRFWAKSWYKDIL